MKYWRLFWKQVCFKHGEEWKIPRQRAKNWRLGVGWGSLKCAINFTDGKVTTKDEMIKNLEKILKKYRISLWKIANETKFPKRNKWKLQPLMISSLGSSVHPLSLKISPHFQVGKSPKLHVDAVRTRAHFRSDTQSMSAIKTSNIH